MIETSAQVPEVEQDSKPFITKKNLRTGLATAAVVGVGAALIEIELIPGLLLGVAAMVAPELVPKVGRSLRPLVRSAIKSGYAATRKTREWAAEAGEQISDMVAEVRSASMEDESTPVHVAAPHSATTVESTGPRGMSGHETASTETGPVTPMEA